MICNNASVLYKKCISYEHIQTAWWWKSYLASEPICWIKYSLKVPFRHIICYFNNVQYSLPGHPSDNCFWQSLQLKSNKKWLGISCCFQDPSSEYQNDLWLINNVFTWWSLLNHTNWNLSKIAVHHVHLISTNSKKCDLSILSVKESHKISSL